MFIWKRGKALSLEHTESEHVGKEETIWLERCVYILLYAYKLKSNFALFECKYWKTMLKRCAAWAQCQLCTSTVPNIDTG